MDAGRDFEGHATRVVSVRPLRARGFQGQLAECLSGLKRRRDQEGAGAGAILRQTFFVRAKNAADHARMRRMIEALALEKGRPIPPTSIIAQAPGLEDRVALEAEIVARAGAALRVESRRAGAHGYRVLSGAGLRRVYAAGLGASGSLGIGAATRAAFISMRRILNKEGLDFGHVVRQWNYIEDILGAAGRQNYQVFNDTRGAFYGKAPFDKGYPAATGIGTLAVAGGVTIDFIAATPGGEKVLPISNPWQTDAHRYDGSVLARGLSDDRRFPPRFERAKMLLGASCGRVFVSGTAAVRGQDTVEADVRRQTRITLDTMDLLVSVANLRAQGLPEDWESAGFSALRVYVKRAGDKKAVRSLCQRRFPGVATLFLEADICRGGLLVEIEGEVDLRRR